MKNVVTRNGVFETNSSSTHSISIASGTYVPDRLPIEDGVVSIYPGEFGWGYESHGDAASKASYCLVYAKQYPGNSHLVDMLVKVIGNEMGANNVQLIQNNDEYHPWGYIDHQSYDVAGDAFTSEQSLRNFIFNSSSSLIIDNDNH